MDYGGFGIGLDVSREIVARHGGRIWFESEPGRGSVFSFSLPLARDAAEGAR
jgi:signal transduction histidine kinase